MATRVLSSQQGKDSISRIQSILNEGLEAQITALTNEGNTLSDANVWDGAKAEGFRGDTWPAASSALKNAKAQLEKLRAEIASINADIMTAGGN